MDGYDSTDPSYDAIASDPYEGTPQADINPGAVDLSLGGNGIATSPQSTGTQQWGAASSDSSLAGFWNAALSTFGIATDYTLTQQQLTAQNAKALQTSTFLGSLGLTNPATGQVSSAALLIGGALVLFLLLRHR